MLYLLSSIFCGINMLSYECDSLKIMLYVILYTMVLHELFK